MLRQEKENLENNSLSREDLSSKNPLAQLLRFIFIAFFLAQSINLLFLSQEDILGIYPNLNSSLNNFRAGNVFFHYTMRLIIIFAIILLVLFIVHRFVVRELKVITILSLQIYFTVLTLCNPIFSVAIGILLLEIMLTVLIIRQERKSSYKIKYLSYGLVLLSTIRLIINAIASPSEILHHDRFKHFAVDKRIVRFDLSNFFISLIFLLALFLIIYFATLIWRNFRAKEKSLSPSIFRKKQVRIFVIIAAACLWILLAYLMLMRSLRMKTPNYDMGIFTQAFEGMKRSGFPITTVERDRELSHFAVHFSPILYLLLPFYFLFSSPLTLQIAQLLLVLLAVFPLRRICKKLGLPAMSSVIAMGLLLVMPQALGSNMYDFHENCFLTVLLLFLFDAILERKKLRIFIFALLTLMVKEDAAVYVFSIGLWQIFSNFSLQEKKTDIRYQLFITFVLILLPIFWFFFASAMINYLGGVTMLSRFSNLNAFSDLGFAGILLSIILQPASAIAGCFTPNKIFYILITFLCFLFLPILQKKASHYFLLLPMLVINILSNWTYQQNFAFQYGYGTVAMLLFASLVWIYERRQEIAGKVAVKQKLHPSEKKASKSENLVFKTFYRKLNKALVLAFSIAFIFSFSYLLLPRAIPVDIAVSQVKAAKEKRQVLELVPRDKKVLVSSHFVADMADIKELYVLDYHNNMNFDPEIELLLVDQANLHSYSELVDSYKSKGYRTSPLTNERILVLEKMQSD